MMCMMEKCAFDDDEDLNEERQRRDVCEWVSQINMWFLSLKISSEFRSYSVTVPSYLIYLPQGWLEEIDYFT